MITSAIIAIVMILAAAAFGAIIAIALDSESNSEGE
jgi:hypothetical protein